MTATDELLSPAQKVELETLSAVHSNRFTAGASWIIKMMVENLK